MIVSLVPVVVVEVVAALLLDVLVAPLLFVSALNPLLSFPGMAFPFLGSWFLFTFSSVILSATFSVALFFSFGILSKTYAFDVNSDVNLSTSDCWISVRVTACWALVNNSFAAVIVAVVFSFSTTLSNNWLNRSIASVSFEVLTFSATSVLIFVPASGAFVSVAGVLTTSSAACTFVLPRTASPEAIATLATPTVNLRMLYLKNLCAWIARKFWFFFIITPPVSIISRFYSEIFFFM